MDPHTEFPGKVSLISCSADDLYFMLSREKQQMVMSQNQGQISKSRMSQGQAQSQAKCLRSNSRGLLMQLTSIVLRARATQSDLAGEIGWMPEHGCAKTKSQTTQHI